MSKCSNCGSVLSCGCQKRKLPNGLMGCTKCVAQLPNLPNTAPTNPTNVKVEIKK